VAQGRKLRDDLWLRVASWLRDDFPIFGCPDDDLNYELAGELSSTRLRFDSNGELVVEDKDSMRKRLGHSPDWADALSMTFAPTPQPMGLILMERGLMGPARRSPGPGPHSPRPSYGHRVWAEDLDDEAPTDLNWDADKERAAAGELPIGPRPLRL
jgi:hypothetical protein